MLDIKDIQKFFDARAAQWDDKFNNNQAAKNIINIFKKEIKGKSILDIGCGTGVLTFPLKEIGANKIVGIDVSKKMIDIAKNKFKTEEFVCDNLLTWNCKERFDVVIMYNVYPHLHPKQKIVNKVYDLLNNNAYFIVAHGASKEEINCHHQSHAAKVSSKLLSANEESKIWSNLFKIDKLYDEELYFFSGYKIYN